MKKKITKYDTRPSFPSKPKLPIAPEKKIIDSAIIMSEDNIRYDTTTISLQSILGCMPANASIKDVYISITHECECNFSGDDSGNAKFQIYYDREGENEKYDLEYKKYQSKLKRYHTALERYNEQYEEYAIELAKYNEYQRDVHIEMLEKEIEDLRKLHNK